MKTPLRIAIGSIFQETNTFLAARTTLDLWRNTFIYERGDMFKLRDSDSEIAGILAALAQCGQPVQVVPLLAARCVSGPINSAECYDTLKSLLLTPLREAMRDGGVDGIILPMHGSMVAEGVEDVEGDLIMAVRHIVGPTVPIVATFDLHAHFTQTMVSHATALLAFEHYPHDDCYQTGEKAVKLLLPAIAGHTRPNMAFAKVPILCGGGNGRTSGDWHAKNCPMAYLTAAARELEKQTGVLSVSILHVHPYNDLPEMGCGALVITDNDPDLAAREATRLANEIWARRTEFEPRLYAVADAVQRGRGISGGPILLVDTADCVGGGSAGDSVSLLRTLTELGVTEPTMLMVVDPAAAQACAKAGIGGTVNTTLGYTVDAQWGAPLQVSGVVRHLFDGEFTYSGGIYGGTRGQMGLSAVLQIGPFQVLIMSRPTYDWADEQYRCAGMDVRQAKFVGVKNPMNYNMAYAGVAKASFIVDTPGPTPATTRHLPYQRMQRPFFPLDESIPNLQPTVYVQS